MNKTAVVEVLRTGLAAVQMLRSIGLTVDEIQGILNGEEISEDELMRRLEMRESAIASRIEGNE